MMYIIIMSSCTSYGGVDCLATTFIPIRPPHSNIAVFVLVSVPVFMMHTGRRGVAHHAADTEDVFCPGERQVPPVVAHDKCLQLRLKAFGPFWLHAARDAVLVPD
jgi:hypothetical protein